MNFRFKHIVCFVLGLCLPVQLLLAGNIENYSVNGQLPTVFRKNVGQWDERILFKSSSNGWGANVSFLKNGLSFGFVKEKSGSAEPQLQHLVFNQHFVNANMNPEVVSEGGVKSQSSYFLGNDASKYKTNVPDYSTITYQRLYPQIDLRYYNSNQKLKYDFIVKPGGDIKDIHIRYDGVRNLSVNKKGELEIHTAWGTLVEQIPVSYQIIEGVRTEVKVEYVVLDDFSFGFKLMSPVLVSAEIIIDPIVLDWSTFVGATPFVDTHAYCYDIAVNNAGEPIITGLYNDGFPITPGVYDVSPNGGSFDIFICKLNATGTALVWSTFVGGSGDEQGNGIDLNAAEEVYITGTVSSANFPTTANAFDATVNGWGDAFFVKLNSTGTQLLYSTYLGANNQVDRGWDIAVDPSGSAYITGVSFGANFPTAAAYDNSYNGGITDAFALKINPSLAGAPSLIYSTYLGSSGDDYGIGIDVNATGEAYVMGLAGANGFPTVAGAYDNLFNGGNADYFVAKLNAAGSTLAYSTYLGGTGNEKTVLGGTNSIMGHSLYDRVWPGAIAVNGQGEAFITGHTASPDFPVTAGAFDGSFGGGTAGYDGSDAFVTKINPSGSALVFSAFLGGSGDDYGYGIKVNSIDEVFVCGWTLSGNFPTTSCAYSTTHLTSQDYSSDYFLTKINTTGSTILYSTYIAGTVTEYFCPRIDIKEDCSDQVYFSGTSHSANFPTTAGVFKPAKGSNNGIDEPVVLKFKPDINPDFNYTQVVDCEVPVQFTDLTTGNCIWQSGPWLPTEWYWDFGDGTTSTDQNPTHTYAGSGTYQVKLVVSCPKDSIIKTITVNPGPNCICTIEADSTIVHASCGQANGSATINVQNASPPITYTWNPNVSTTSTANNIVSGNYTVYIQDAGGACKDTVYFTINNTPNPDLSFVVTHVSCPGFTDGAIDLTVTSGTLPFGYSWSNLAVTEDLNNIGANTYNITVTDANGCTADTSIVVNEPNPQNMQVTANGATTICIGDSAQLSATVVPAGQYNYTWNPGNIVGNQIWVKPLLTQEYTVSVNDNCGNPPVTDVVTVTVAAIPSAVMLVDDTVGCEPLCVNFSDDGVGGYDCYWTFGDSKGSAGCDVTYCYPNSGVYSVSLTISDANGCTNTFTKPNWITVYENPVADFSADPEETTTYFPDVHFTDLSQYATMWYWYFGDGDLIVDGTQHPTHQYPEEEEGVYTAMLIAENGEGCRDTAYKPITIRADWSFYIPNTFTPNADGRNNLFSGKGINISEYEMWVFDRWGNQIFHCTDINDGWDGKVQNGASGETAQIDTYVWLVQLRDNLKKPHRFVGHVNLLK